MRDRRCSTLFAASTALILFLAANTSFNAFPRLAAILAEDGYMPRQFSFRGDRLAYSWGIVLLAAVAFLSCAAFGGDTHALIPLYSVGVFLCFTLSQLGMVKHWLRGRESGWRWRLGVNADGRRPHGRRPRHRRVREVRGRRVPRRHPRPAPCRDDVVHQPPVRPVAAPAGSGSGDSSSPRPKREERIVVPIHGVDRATIQAVNVGRSIDDDVRAVHISDDPAEAARVRAAFERQIPGVPLVVVDSPYRALAGPLLAYLDVLDAAWPPDKPEPITFVVIPEYVASSWWERLLYNQSAKSLRRALLGRPHTVVVNVPYRREESDAVKAPTRAEGEEDTEAREASGT